MSEFDKEAERERLREKFAREREKEQMTEHMSELLLRGATMLNAHCENCGSPLFRYDGQEFCPTCQMAAGTETDEGASDDGARAEGGQTDGADVVADDARRDDAGGETGGTDEAEGAPGPVVEPASGDGSTSDDRSGGDGRVEGASTATGPAATGDARAALDAAITRLARRATETDDPRRAREFLAAAREAAETLATLDGTQ